MRLFQNLILTEVFPPFTVFSEKGRTALMTERSCYGISFCISGQITYTLGETKTVSNPNNAVLLPKGATYSLHGDKQGLFPLINFQCEGFRQERLMSVSLRRPQEYLEIYKAMSALSGDTGRWKMFSLFYDLLDRLEKELSAKPLFLLQADRFIKDHLSDPALFNQKIADRLGVSEVYLRKLFSAHYGMSPKQYILQLRIDRAKLLLANTMNTVTAVSEECGFASVYHFCRIFKEKTGCTPSDYAKQNRAMLKL